MHQLTPQQTNTDPGDAAPSQYVGQVRPMHLTSHAMTVDQVEAAMDRNDKAREIMYLCECDDCLGQFTSPRKMTFICPACSGQSQQAEAAWPMIAAVIISAAVVLPLLAAGLVVLVARWLA